MWQIVICDGRAVTFGVHRVETLERMEGDPWCWRAVWLSHRKALSAAGPPFLYLSSRDEDGTGGVPLSPTSLLAAPFPPLTHPAVKLPVAHTSPGCFFWV